MITIKKLREPYLGKGAITERIVDIDEEKRMAGDILSFLMKKGYLADIEVEK